jgi:hypothetical protein
LVKLVAAFCAADTQDENREPLGVLLGEAPVVRVLLSSDVGVRGAVIEFESLLG